MGLNLLAPGDMLRKNYKDNKCLDKKKFLNPVRILKRKTKNLEKTSHMIKKVFFTSERDRVKNKIKIQTFGFF